MSAARAQYALRAAGVDDAAAMTDLIHVAFEEYRGHLTPPSGAHTETLTTIAQLLAREAAYVAWAPGPRAAPALVGCIFATPRTADAAYLHRLAVHPAYRGMGIATALLAAAEAWAQAQGFAAVTLHVRIALPANRRLYERLGYAVIGDGAHPGMEQPTYLIMRKRVAADSGNVATARGLGQTVVQ